MRVGVRISGHCAGRIVSSISVVLSHSISLSFSLSLKPDSCDLLSSRSIFYCQWSSMLTASSSYYYYWLCLSIIIIIVYLSTRGAVSFISCYCQLLMYWSIGVPVCRVCQCAVSSTNDLSIDRHTAAAHRCNINLHIQHTNTHTQIRVIAITNIIIVQCRWGAAHPSLIGTPLPMVMTSYLWSIIAVCVRVCVSLSACLNVCVCASGMPIIWFPNVSISVCVCIVPPPLQSINPSIYQSLEPRHRRNHDNRQPIYSHIYRYLLYISVQLPLVFRFFNYRSAQSILFCK